MSSKAGRWHDFSTYSRTHPTTAGQPPVVQNVGTEATETLGELMLYDKNVSPNRSESLRVAMPYAGFSGPISD